MREKPRELNSGAKKGGLKFQGDLLNHLMKNMPFQNPLLLLMDLMKQEFLTS